MAAHIRKRKNRGKRGGYTYYLVDGSLEKSLETQNKGIAEERLKQYIKGKLKLDARPDTVEGYYRRWIEKQTHPLVRASAPRDYKQHFEAYILPELGSTSLVALTIQQLSLFRSKLLARVSLKTSRNIIDSSFRAMWRSALEEGVVEHNPFAALKWPRKEKKRPDAFTIDERERIITYWGFNDPFYFPWLLTLFRTGMRPSEAAALRLDDVNLDDHTIRITKSRYMGHEDATKTRHSTRFIKVDDLTIRAIRSLVNLGLCKGGYVFCNKYGDPINSKKWGEHYWRDGLAKAGVRYIKFYATRHTFITQMVAAGKNLKEIADYCGTSVQMIEENYCKPLEMELTEKPQNVVDVGVSPESDPSKIRPEARNYAERLVAGPGFEPVPLGLQNVENVLSSGKIKGLRNRKTG
jgi:integrase